MKCVEQFTEINKLCNFASCWLYFGTLMFVSVFIVCWILFSFVVHVSCRLSYFKRESEDRGVN